MLDLSKLLERFSKSLGNDSYVRDMVIGVVSKHTKISLKPENISLKDGVLEISTSPIAKNEISLKEALIRSELKEVYKINFSRILYR